MAMAITRISRPDSDKSLLVDRILSKVYQQTRVGTRVYEWNVYFLRLIIPRVRVPLRISMFKFLKIINVNIKCNTLYHRLFEDSKLIV